MPWKRSRPSLMPPYSSGIADAQQAELGRLLVELERDLALLVPLVDEGRDLLVEPFAQCRGANRGGSRS